ncbi:MAG: hypothetical protein Q8P67_08335, partial [archaeon]|nr:hypothetical protein [archaeon]
ETPILSSSSSPSPPLSHQQKQESSIKAGSLETSESANENVVLPGSSSTHSLKISAPMQESPTDQRFAQLVQRFNGHAAVAASNDLARLLAMIRL